MKTGFAASVAALTLFTAGHARATDGTWNVDASGTWNSTVATPWSTGSVAGGADSTANFNSVNITADRTVTLTESQIVGNLIFGDTVSSNGWTLAASGTSVLTLQKTTGTPTVTVNSLASGKSVTISATLAGTQGFVKDGGGALILSGSHALLTGTLTVLSGTLDLRDTVSAYSNTIVLTSATSTLDAANPNLSSIITINGNITGSGRINKNGGVSTLVLNGNNDYSGGTTLSAGILALGTGSYNGIGTGTLTLNGGTLRSTDGNSRTINNTLSFGSLNLTLGGAQSGLGQGDLIFTWSGTTSIGGGKTWTVNNSTTATFNNNWTGNTGWSITKAGTGNLIFNGSIGSGTISVIANAGNLVLNGTNSLYSGSTAIVGGTLSATKLADINTASSIGKGSAAGSANDLVINGGTLRYTGAGDSSNRPFTLGNGGGTIEASGSGALALTGSVVLTSGSARTFILTGTNTGANSFGANLVDDGSNATSFTKSGVGRWILTGSNTYTGATTINNGELDVNGSLGAGSTVTISSGAILGGSGKIGGSVNSTGGTVNGNGLNISGSATFTGASTLSGLNTVGSATISSGSTNLSGTTTVSSGTFSVAMGATLNNNGVISGTTSVAGLMKGNGSILGDLALSGTLSPGNSTGTTTINGNLAMESSAVLVMEVTGLNSHDLVSVSGNVQLAGTLDLSTLSGLSLGDTITLIDNTGIGTITNGYFSEIITTGSTYIIAGASTTYTIIIGENKYLINYAANAGGDSAFNDVTLTVIPEPATWAMIMGGLGMLAFGQRLRRQQ